MKVNFYTLKISHFLFGRRMHLLHSRCISPFDTLHKGWIGQLHPVTSYLMKKVKNHPRASDALEEGKVRGGEGMQVTAWRPTRLSLDNDASK